MPISTERGKGSTGRKELPVTWGDLGGLGGTWGDLGGTVHESPDLFLFMRVLIYFFCGVNGSMVTWGAVHESPDLFFLWRSTD